MSSLSIQQIEAECDSGRDLEGLNPIYTAIPRRSSSDVGDGNED